MLRSKFIELKLHPAWDNLNTILNAFSGVGLDRSDYAKLQSRVDGLLGDSAVDGEAPSAEDEAVLEQLTRAVRDMENLIGVINGEEPEEIPDETQQDSDDYGEKVGELFSTHVDKDQKVSKLFGSFKDKIAKKIPSSVKDTWEKAVHGISRIEDQSPVDTSHLNPTLSVIVAKALNSSITQDGQVGSLLAELHSSLEKISSLFSNDELNSAKLVAAYVLAWPDVNDFLPESIFSPVTGMANYLNDYEASDNIESLEFARSELRLIEKTTGYNWLVVASNAVGEKQKLKILYNDNVDISVAENATKFREALEGEEFHKAAFLYAGDKGATDEKREEEERARLEAEMERIEAERREAAEQEAIQRAAAAQAQQIASQQSGKKEGILDSVGSNRGLLGKVCKNPACGFQNSHLAYKCKECGRMLGL